MALSLIVGLGNPGNEYANTRHNAGYWFIDRLAEQLGERFLSESKLHAQVARARLGGENLLLVKPTTFMNRSGQCLSAVLRYYKIDPADCLVAHDELDLPTGSARFKFGGGHGGQNGLRDIKAHLGHGDFHRLRIGIGHPGHKDRVTPWVLGRPSSADEKAIVDSIERAVQHLPLALEGRMDEAMKRLHTAPDAKS